MDLLNNLKIFIVELVEKSFFHVKIFNPKDITSPIVKAINSKNDKQLIEALSGVKNAIEGKENAEVVKVSNYTDLTPQIENLGLIIKTEIAKLDKEVIVKNDLSQLLGLFKTNQDKKEVVEALKRIEKIIPSLSSIPDYTLLFDELIATVERLDFKIDLSPIVNVIKEIPQFEIPEKLIDDDRIKVVFSDKQLEKMGGKEAEYKLKQIKEEDPQKYGRIKKYVKWDILKITSTEREFSYMGVKNGERAKMILKYIKKQDNPKESFKRLKEAGIISDEVEKQIKKLLEK